MEENKLYAEIDRLRAENDELKAQMKKDFEEAVAVIHDEGVRRIMAEDERDGYRNGQAQLQKICNDLQDVITEYADERKRLKAQMEKDFEEAVAVIHDEGSRRIMAEEENIALKAELDRLKAPIENWEENVAKGICP